MALAGAGGLPPLADSEPVSVEIVELPPVEQLKREWSELESRSDCSFFTSWAWMGCWLASLPPALRPKLIRASGGGKCLGLGLLASHSALRNGVIPVRRWHLNTAGDPLLDELFIEYNGFLVDRANHALVSKRLLEHLLEQRDWEELYLDGVTEAPLFGVSGGAALRVRRQPRTTFHVDLDLVRGKGGDYLAVLGPRTRAQVRRSMREYGQLGELEFRVATSAAEAAGFYHELKRLHQAYWQLRGLPGSFANRQFDLFHQNLIEAAVSGGRAQLCRITAGGRPLGYLYNLVHRGVVHNYQSGFDYSIGQDDNPNRSSYRPGLVSHTLAIEHNARQGERTYDLMAGASQYKKSLATGTGEMEWVVLQRDRWKFRVENRLRELKERLRKR